jgi:hypothetical protein
MTVTPSVVAIYDLGTGVPRRVAEFRFVENEVSLRILDPDGCGFARRWYTLGVERQDGSGIITPDDGAAFMHALLQPFQMSYYRIVDESAHTTFEPE